MMSDETKAPIAFTVTDKPRRLFSHWGRISAEVRAERDMYFPCITGQDDEITNRFLGAGQTARIVFSAAVGKLVKGSGITIDQAIVGINYLIKRDPDHNKPSFN